MIALKDAARWLWMFGLVTLLAFIGSTAVSLLGAAEASLVIGLVGVVFVVSMLLAGGLS